MSQKNAITLTEKQILISNENKKYLSNQGIDYGLLSITQTGLDKSIMDAVGSLRVYLKINEFHDYNEQMKGDSYRIKKKCIFSLNKDGAIETIVSLYRPESKNGDPRIWVYKLKRMAVAGDEIAFVIHDGILYVFNISSYFLHDNSIVNDIIRKSEIISYELLTLLKLIRQKGPLVSIANGDTGIGMTIEKALGILPNSSPAPDYKGIELKSARSKELTNSNRSTLFAQVANWNISKLKSSAEILDKYGYERNGDLRLYATINALKPNSQGLYFSVDIDNDCLNEVHHIDGNVVSWLGDTLRSKLLEKHKETFWIKANSFEISGEEHFELESVIHTKNPLQNQFLILMEKGIITMDHLIKKKDMIGSVKEKGPLFKIHEKNLHLLFPEKRIYSLV